MTKDRPVFLVPTYDIDLIWHSHQLHPIAYARHTSARFGTILDHDDTDTDRGEGAKLHSSFLGTCNKWWATFGTVYERAGAMYRGPEPHVEPIPPSPDNDPKALEEERRLLEFTYKRRWNSSSFDSHMESCAEDSPDAYLRSTFEVRTPRQPRSCSCTNPFECFWWIIQMGLRLRMIPFVIRDLLQLWGGTGLMRNWIAIN